SGSQRASEESNSRIGDDFAKILTTLEGFESRLDKVLRHARAALENSEQMRLRAVNRLSWSDQRLKQAMASGAPADIAGSATKLLEADGIHIDPAYDRLTDVFRRGSLRVAIEPSFVGLSFRRTRDAALEGLDVEYAKAFARHLGVACNFVEGPWDVLTEYLHIGTGIGQAPADIVISALPPNPEFKDVAYSETYTYLNWVMARRCGDTSITGLNSLEGKTMGIINDPGAFRLLEGKGVRWPGNADVPGGRVNLKALVAYSDQSKIHDCLADGVVDAFGVDLPIYYWACSSPHSPWHGRIEICTDSLADVPYYYTAAVRHDASSFTLLREFNRFLAGFLTDPARAELERAWQGKAVAHTLSYRDEPWDFAGEAELAGAWTTRYGRPVEDAIGLRRMARGGRRPGNAQHKLSA
ncbi:MAG: transporter substrate-binding domain-containing protein, partial [Pseudomonadota bacterium]